MLRRPLLLLLAALAPAAADAQPRDRALDSARAVAEIRAKILRGAEGFERGDPAMILAHYARDVVLSYPGERDMGYDTLAAGYAQLRARPASVTARTVPTFDEILVSGDLAVVRLRWTTTIADAAAGRSATRRMKDLQVWRREPGGAWLFARGMHYREPEPWPNDGASAPAPAEGPEALLARAVERAGGAAALERARVLAWEGDAAVHHGGRTVAIAGRWAVRPPDSAVVATWPAARGPSAARTMVIAAPRGWSVTGGAFAALPERMLTNEREAFYLYEVMRLVSLRDPGVSLAPAPADSLGQRGFTARRAGRPDATLYVDADGRLAHVRMQVHDPDTGAPVRQDAWLSGVVEADGVRWPRTLRLTLDGRPYFDLAVRALRILPRLDDPLLAGPR